MHGIGAYNIKIAVLFIFAALLASACTGAEKKQALTQNNEYYGETKIIKTVMVELGPNAALADINALHKQAESVFHSLGEEKFNEDFEYQGLSYNLAPSGAVNALSQVEINCLSSMSGQNGVNVKFCGEFIETLSEKYKSANK